MKIAVYTITKNEQKFVKRWAESCADADYRLIVDTGSTDNTVEEAIANGCDVRSITVRPWRFDDARNAALALLPEDIDICIALDADEVLVKGWREALERTPAGINRPRYKYVWSWAPDGSEGLVYSGDKIHSRHNFRWVHPVHEVLACTTQENQWFCEGLIIHHYPDNTKSRSQYLPLLELAVRERPDDDRNQFYLGREYMFHGQNQNAETHLLKALELSKWKPERATAMRYLSRVTDDREGWLLRACAEAPNRREPWVETAQMYYSRQEWALCLACCQKALQIGTKPLEYLCEEEAWSALPYDLASVAAWQIGAHKLSVQYSESAIEKNPLDARLRANCSLLHALTAKKQISVIIPTKSNISGLRSLVETLRSAKQVAEIIIVADGDVSSVGISLDHTFKGCKLLTVSEGSGIHVMWNVGMKNASSGNHLAFLNDDITINGDTLVLLGGLLDNHPELGLVSPNYDDRHFSTVYQSTDQPCRGRYDGSGGLAGFCMVLAEDLVQEWSFDESMRWWYGDDDVINWVTRIKKRIVGISAFSKCSNNSSWTIENDPPRDFAQIVEKDRIRFVEKWGG